MPMIRSGYRADPRESRRAMSRLAACLAALAIALTAIACGSAASAMTMTVASDQLIASGSIDAEDGARFRALVTAYPNITTVVLHDSPGGVTSANLMIAAAIEARGLDTVVTGYCVSACAMVFLSGTNRSFGDLEPLASTSLGFHGNYVRGTLGSERYLQALKNRVLRRTGGKIDPALVDRWLHLTDNRSSIRFRYPGEEAATAPTTFFCAAGRPPNGGDYANCEPIAGTNALASGIITSTRIVHVNR
jgi:hypothetical protein